MKSLLIAPFLATALFGQQQQSAPRPPVAAKHPHVTTIHGVKLVDDYFWLRNKGDSAVIHHLEAENAYTAAVMKPTERLQQTMYDEMLHRIKQTDTTASYRWATTSTSRGPTRACNTRRSCGGAQARTRRRSFSH